MDGPEAAGGDRKSSAGTRRPALAPRRPAHAAGAGATRWRACPGARPDAALVNNELPDADGDELARRMAAPGRPVRPRLIAMSVIGRSEDP
jgi:CheY-like chemotaxis protein